MDAGAVELELVLTGLKKAQDQLKAFQEKAGQNVAPKRDPFAAYNKAKEATEAARKLKAELSTLGGVARVAGRQAQKAFVGLGQTMRGVEAGVDKLMAKYGAFIKVTGGLAISAFAANIVRVGVASEQAGRRLSFLAAGYGEVAGATASVARVSAVLQTSTLQTEQAFSKFYGSLRPAGLELAEIETIYVGIAKAGRLAGAGTSELQSGLLQVKQAFASGRLAGDELRSVLENLPALGVEIAKAYDRLNGTTGTTVGALRDLGAAGQLTNDVLFEATKQLALKDIPPPTNLEAIGKAFEDMSQNIAKAIGPAVVDMMSTFAAAVQVASEWVQANADAITGLVKGVLSFIKFALPFAAAVGTIVGAIKLWRLATIAAAKAQALLQAFSGPKGWAVLAAGAAVYLGAAATIDRTSKGITEGMNKVGERTKKLKEEFKELVLGIGDGKGFKAKLQIQGLTQDNERLKQAEKLALEQAKALYGPQTQAVIAARTKAAQAEREAAIAQQQARNAGGTDDKLNNAAKEAANAQLVAAEAAANVIADAYKEARNTALEAADALGEARSTRAKQLFNKDEGINQFLSGSALGSRRKEGIALQKNEAGRLKRELVKSFAEAGNFMAARQIGGKRFGSFEERQKFIDAARDELYGQKALITANEKLQKALTDLNTTSSKALMAVALHRKRITGHSRIQSTAWCKRTGLWALRPV